ncbi:MULTISPECIES: hypothetical protein [unclassified Burkholderia]|uniref:hypothetical protein n=1 Tax=unclassified Burkholderia TaxID=2613784 RepID=UPI000F57CF72|nr:MULTISPECIES: hypothetical protein [unclassified Burkholderia]RQR39786.1 hypothetical protein DIE22_06275 [Burkholderia sp. Bp9142]RQR53573.1 hypothetical protein DIE21_10105 [Burkholderia sp. Bp9140]
MKRMLFAAIVLASTLGAARAQTQTFHFGEGQLQPRAAAPTARPAPTRPHVTAPPHHRRTVHKRRHGRSGKPARSGIDTHA